MASGRRKTPMGIREDSGMVTSKYKMAWVEETPPECPGWLSPLAKEEWARIIPLLRLHKLIARIDLVALASYCHCYAELQKAAIELERDGPVIAMPSGMPKAHPCIAYIDKLMSQLIKWCTKFGLTPSSRARIELDLDVGSPAGEEKSEFEEFLSAPEISDAPDRQEIGVYDGS